MQNINLAIKRTQKYGIIRLKNSLKRGFMKKIKIGAAGMILLFLVAVLYIGQTIHNDNQASPALILDLSLQGEYKIGEATGSRSWKENIYPPMTEK